MKNNLENSIKESLESFEAPYNPDAWKAMSTKLDTVMPTSSFGTSLKWIAAASVIVVASVSTYFIFKEDGTAKQNTIQIADTTEKTTENKANTSTPDSNTSNEEKSINQSENLNAIIDENVSYSNDEESLENNVVVDSSIEDVTAEVNENVDSIKEGNDDSKSDVIVPIIHMPKMSALCSGESVSIKNTNTTDLEITGPGYNKIIKANSTLNTELENVGTYTIYNSINNSTSTFNVKSLPKVDFTIDHENKFENGLPTIRLTSASGSDLTWNVNNIEYKGNEIDIHMYNRGVQNITLTSQGSNGCDNSVNKQVFNEEKYNLMAVNSFIPNDNDPRLNTFMPFALTQRNTKFTLIIIDPTDGHNVYQTNDSSHGWDGTDMKTGQQVKYETTYIWKVFIDTPERGENNEYAGNIIPITK